MANDSASSFDYLKDAEPNRAFPTILIPCMNTCVSTGTFVFAKTSNIDDITDVVDPHVLLRSGVCVCRIVDVIVEADGSCSAKLNLFRVLDEQLKQKLSILGYAGMQSITEIVQTYEYVVVPAFNITDLAFVVKPHYLINGKCPVKAGMTRAFLLRYSYHVGNGTAKEIQEGMCHPFPSDYEGHSALYACSVSKALLDDINAVNHCIVKCLNRGSENQGYFCRHREKTRVGILFRLFLTHSTTSTLKADFKFRRYEREVSDGLESTQVRYDRLAYCFRYETEDHLESLRSIFTFTVGAGHRVKRPRVGDTVLVQENSVLNYVDGTGNGAEVPFNMRTNRTGIDILIDSTGDLVVSTRYRRIVASGDWATSPNLPDPLRTMLLRKSGSNHDGSQQETTVETYPFLRCDAEFDRDGSCYRVISVSLEEQEVNAKNDDSGAIVLFKNILEEIHSRIKEKIGM